MTDKYIGSIKCNRIDNYMECGWVVSSTPAQPHFLVEIICSKRLIQIGMLSTDAYREYYVSVLISSVSGKAFLGHAERFDMHSLVEKHEPCNLFLSQI